MNLSLQHSHRLPRIAFSALLIALCPALTACGGGSGSSSGGGSSSVAAPVVTATAAQNGAQIISLSDTASGAIIYYTVDGSTPSSSSPQYFAPFLMASSATIKAIAISGGDTSGLTTQAVTASVTSGSLIWSDEFTNNTGSNTAPDSTTWTYDTGAGGWGNSELETYCTPTSSSSPCDSANPNAYVGTDGYLHVVARQPSAGVYTSARMKSQGHLSFSYGRVEARIKMPEGQGLWPAFWALGNNITTVNWPACGEQDIMEHINAPSPDWVAGSIHGTNLNLTQNYPGTVGPSSFNASDWHIYGMIWDSGTVKYYVDSPTNIYASYSTGTQGTWPFDSGSGNFLILNLAVGGNWPGAPNSSTSFPSEMLVDYVRVYKN